MHPRRDRVRNNVNRAKFADTVIDLMLGRMMKQGAEKSRIRAKLFGGACMFARIGANRGLPTIGEENVAVSRSELAARGIPIVAEATGGEKGRMLVFDVADGSVRVRDAWNNEEVY